MGSEPPRHRNKARRGTRVHPRHNTRRRRRSAPRNMPPGYQPGMFQRGGSGFLGSALTTAAGVAGGLVVGNALMGMFERPGLGGGFGAPGGFGGGSPWGAPAGAPGQGAVDQGTWDNGGAAAPDQGAVDQGTWDQPDTSGGDSGGWSDPGGSDPGGGGGSDDSIF